MKLLYYLLNIVAATIQTQTNTYTHKHISTSRFSSVNIYAKQETLFFKKIFMSTPTLFLTLTLSQRKVRGQRTVKERRENDS